MNLLKLPGMAIHLAPQAGHCSFLRAVGASGVAPSILGVTSPFFPGIFLSTKPPKALGKQRSVFEKKDG